MGLHVMHLAMETFFQPLHQSSFRRRQIHACHADLGKSQLQRPVVDLLDKGGISGVHVLPL